MFTLNDDLSIYATRGDIVFFTVSAEDKDTKEIHKFQPGDVVRIKVYGKKDAENVVLQKDFPVTEVTEKVEIFLAKEDTKIGEVISKHKDYWYEVILNDDTLPQTIIGYDEDGAKLFRLFPEGDDIPPYVPTDPAEIPLVDKELDPTSHRPIENQAVAKAVAKIEDICERTHAAVAEMYVTPEMFGAIGDGEADDTEAVQKALDYAYKNKLYFRSYKEYKITSQIVIKASCFIKSIKAYIADGFAVKICGSYLNVEIENLESNFGGVMITSEGDTVGNAVYSTFKFGAIFAETVGLFINRCKYYYNSVYYNLIQGLQKSIYLLSSESNDFINENNFYGGLCGARYVNQKSEYALYVETTGTSEIGKNKFFSFSPESSTKGMYLCNCADMHFYDSRFNEMGNNPVINIKNTWGTILFQGGFVRLPQINIEDISANHGNRIVRFDNVRFVNADGVPLRVKWLEFFETSTGLKLTFDKNAPDNYDVTVIREINNSITWDKIVNGGLPGSATTIGRIYRTEDCDVIFDSLLFNQRNISDFYLVQPKLSADRTVTIGDAVIPLTQDNNYKILHFMCKPPTSENTPTTLWYYEVLPWEAGKIN